MDDHPAQAVRSEAGLSMNVCARMCKEGRADGWVLGRELGGDHGGRALHSGPDQGRREAALGPSSRPQTGFTYFLDVGANVDSKPEYLVQFAAMGAVYARQMMGRTNPRVGLLSNGEEEGKGDDLVRETYPRLKGSMRWFVGNIEPQGPLCRQGGRGCRRRLCRQHRDQDGRGDGRLPVSQLAGGDSEIDARQDWRVADQGRRRASFGRIDWREFGGAPLLGIDGVAVVAHGRSDARAIKNAIRVAKEAAENQLVGKIRAEVGKR